MSLTVTDLAEEVRETNRRLADAVDALRGEVSDLRVQVAEINTNLRWVKGVGRIVAGSAVAVLVLVGTGVYRFGHVEHSMAELQRDTAELRKETTELRTEFKTRDDRVSHALERIEKSLPAAPKGDRPAPST